MGLDMYLKASRYCSNYDFCKDEEKALYAALLKTAGLELTDTDQSSPSATVDFTVCYWRKANQIHNWFVEKVQDGKDECLPHYVSREQLTELRDACRQALANRQTATEVLPPKSGFFFGTTEIDEYYWQDLEHTDKALTRILDNPKFEKWGFEYRSSW